MDFAMSIDLEQTMMELLINAGEARSCAMLAIQSARQQAWEEADQQLAASQQAAREAHKVQTQLIMVHAQDHLMTAILCRDLAEEMVMLRKEMYAGAAHRGPHLLDHAVQGSDC